MKKIKTRTMSEMAALYEVSEADFETQLQEFAFLRNKLKREGFLGKYFYPVHQKTVFKYLGNPIQEERFEKGK